MSYLGKINCQGYNSCHIAGDQHGQGQQADGGEVIHFAAFCAVPRSEIRQQLFHLSPPHALTRADTELPGEAFSHVSLARRQRPARPPAGGARPGGGSGSATGRRARPSPEAGELPPAPRCSQGRREGGLGNSEHAGGSSRQGSLRRSRGNSAGPALPPRTHGRCSGGQVAPQRFPFRDGPGRAPPDSKMAGGTSALMGH